MSVDCTPSAIAAPMRGGRGENEKPVARGTDEERFCPHCSGTLKNGVCANPKCQ
jgi:hypothetical protein